MRQQLIDNNSKDKHSHKEVLNAFKEIKSQASSIGGNVDVSNSGYMLIVTYLLRWRGSIYRLIWIDLLIWLIMYYTLNLVYRLALNEHQRVIFQNLVEQVGEWSNKLPVTFLLGFFVSNVMSRWWNIFMSIPRMRGPAHTLVSTIEGEGCSDELAASYRVAIGRYLNLAWILALTSICGGLRCRFNAVKRLVMRFGHKVEVTDADEVIFGSYDENDESNDFDQLMLKCISDNDEVNFHCKSLQLLAIANCDPEIRKQIGQLITPDEMQVFIQRAQKAGPSYTPEWFIPIHWALELSNTAVQKGLVRNSVMLLKLQAEIRAWSAKIRLLLNFSKRHLPLVYTQVAIIAVYTVYLTDVLSRQLLDPKDAIKRKSKGYYIDYFIPILAIVHVIFMIGWFKVALVLLDPLGNDDEDFPLSDILNGNMKIVRSHCGNNCSWYPRSLAADGKGPDSDDAALQLLRDCVAKGQQQQQQQQLLYGTFAAAE